MSEPIDFTIVKRIEAAIGHDVSQYTIGTAVHMVLIMKYPKVIIKHTKINVDEFTVTQIVSGFNQPPPLTWSFDSLDAMAKVLAPLAAAEAKADILSAQRRRAER